MASIVGKSYGEHMQPVDENKPQLRSLSAKKMSLLVNDFSKWCRRLHFKIFICLFLSSV